PASLMRVLRAPSTPFPYATLFRSARGETENADSLWVHSKASCILSRYAHGFEAIGYRQGNRFGAPPAHLSRVRCLVVTGPHDARSEEHTSELQSRENLVCRLLLEK